MECRRPNNVHDGIELAVRSVAQNEWVPLRHYSRTSGTGAPHHSYPITRGRVANGYVNIRGYSVPLITGEEFMTQEVKVCDRELYSTGVQVRWLQTSNTNNNNKNARLRESWYIDNVNITFSNGNYNQLCLLDDFNNQTGYVFSRYR